MNRYTEFFKYAQKLGITDDDRAEMVRNYTGGRTSSLRELSDSELTTLTDHIALQHKLSIRSRRSVVLGIIQEMIGKCITRSEWWNAVDKICTNPRIAGKPFKELSIAELDKVAVKLRVIARKRTINKVEDVIEPEPPQQEPVIFCRLPLICS